MLFYVPPEDENETETETQPAAWPSVRAFKLLQHASSTLVTFRLVFSLHL